jgi:hypothetical protein
MRTTPEECDEGAREPPCKRNLTISEAFGCGHGVSSTPNEGAAAWIAPSCRLPDARMRSRTTATRVTRGAICLSRSSHFPLMLYSNATKPVALPPGRARLSTKPPQDIGVEQGSAPRTTVDKRAATLRGSRGRAPGGPQRKLEQDAADVSALRSVLLPSPVWALARGSMSPKKTLSLI